MSKMWMIFFGVAVAVAASGVTWAQFPIMNMVAEKVIQKYQGSSCETLWQGKPKPENEQRMVEMLRQDPQMRQAFFEKISAPIVNKMFECGMIP